MCTAEPDNLLARVWAGVHGTQHLIPAPRGHFLGICYGKESHPLLSFHVRNGPYGFLQHVCGSLLTAQPQGTWQGVSWWACLAYTALVFLPLVYAFPSREVWSGWLWNVLWQWHDVPVDGLVWDPQGDTTLWSLVLLAGRVVLPHWVWICRVKCSITKLRKEACFSRLKYSYKYNCQSKPPAQVYRVASWSLNFGEESSYPLIRWSKKERVRKHTSKEVCVQLRVFMAQTCIKMFSYLNSELAAEKLLWRYLCYWWFGWSMF